MSGNTVNICRVWLIGGTSDSVEIAKVLVASQTYFVVTVATIAAQSLYPDECEIAVGSMDVDQMKFFCRQNEITLIVDASHPYADLVSLQAIATANTLNISYLRYERECYQNPCSKQIRSNMANIIELDSFERLLTSSYMQDQRVLLTVGCKILPHFQSWQGQATLFARVLPHISSLETALAAGFTSDRLITIRPPLSVALEKALWQQWNISLVITKASGIAGGEDIKHQVAADLNIPLIVITRPQVSYPRQTSSTAEVLTFCQGI